MNLQTLETLLANGEDTRHQFKRDFVLASHAFQILSCGGLGNSRFQKYRLAEAGKWVLVPQEAR